MELGETLGAYGRLLMLINRKSELVLAISELNMKRTIASTIRDHLLEKHWGTGHNDAHKFEQQVRVLDDELEPVTAEYEEVCSQITQLVSDMKKKGVDLLSKMASTMGEART